MIRRLAAVAAAGLLLLPSGCYRAEEELAGGALPDAYEAGSSVTFNEETAAAATVTAATAAAATVRSPAPIVSVATAAKAGKTDSFLLQQCINFNYAYPIVQAVAQGKITPEDEEKLRAELTVYESRNQADGGETENAAASITDAFTPISKEDAEKLARQYIERLFDPPAGLPAMEPTSLELRDFREDPPRDWLGWETYYEISYEMPHPTESGYTLFYSASVDGRTGALVSGNFGKSGTPAPAELLPTNRQVQEMQQRAEGFVTEKELVPGASVRYVCSSTWGGSSSELQTEVYLSDGTVVDIHEGYAQGTRLYFHLFPTHGFAG